METFVQGNLTDILGTVGARCTEEVFRIPRHTILLSSRPSLTILDRAMPIKGSHSKQQLYVAKRNLAQRDGQSYDLHRPFQAVDLSV